MQQITRLKNLPLKTLALAGLMTAFSVAASALTCSTSGTPTVDFGTVDVLSGIYPTASQTITITCTKPGIESGRETRQCLNIGEGTGSSVGIGGPNAYSPRILKSDDANGNGTGFQIYQDGGYSTFWGTDSGFPPNKQDPDQVRRPAFFTSYSQSHTLYMRMEPLSTGINLTTSLQTTPPGIYKSDFSGIHTSFKAPMRTVTLAIEQNCSDLYLGTTGEFPFKVQATVLPNCKITTPAADIDFGTQAGTATNLQGTTAVAVQCTRTTPYFIGLRPGNGNTAGAGVMSATSPVGNTDTVPYQLRQATGMNGTIWGNTAISSAVGNGVAGTGLGSSAISYPIYATVPTANRAAGSYQDTVTITVNY